VAIDDARKQLEDLDKTLAASRQALHDVMEEKSALGVPPYPDPDRTASRDRLPQNEVALDREEQAQKEQLFPNKLERYEYLTTEQARLEKQIDGLERERGSTQETINNIDGLLGAMGAIDQQFDKALGVYGEAVNAYGDQIRALKKAGDRREFTAYDLGTLAELGTDIHKCNNDLIALENQKSSLYTQLRDILDGPQNSRARAGPSPSPQEGVSAPARDDSPDIASASREQRWQGEENAINLGGSDATAQLSKDVQKGVERTVAIVEKDPQPIVTSPMHEPLLQVAFAVGAAQSVLHKMGKSLEQSVERFAQDSAYAIVDKVYALEEWRLNRQESKEQVRIASDQREERQFLHDMHERQQPGQEQMQRDAQAMERMHAQDVEACTQKFAELREAMLARHEKERSEREHDQGPDRSVDGKVKDLIQAWDRGEMTRSRSMEQPREIPAH
jgi:hypothetical protein